MIERDEAFTRKFLGVAREHISRHDQHRREVEQLITRELTKRDRWSNAVIVLTGLTVAGVLLVLAVRAKDLPWYPVLPALFYLFLAAMIVGGVAIHTTAVIRGRFSDADRATKADWTMWCSIALAGILLIWWYIHPDIEDELYFALVAVAVVLLAVAESLRWQIRLSQRRNQEYWLKTRLHFVELMERIPGPDASPDHDQPDGGNR